MTMILLLPFSHCKRCCSYKLSPLYFPIITIKQWCFSYKVGTSYKKWALLWRSYIWLKGCNPGATFLRKLVIFVWPTRENGTIVKCDSNTKTVISKQYNILYTECIDIGKSNILTLSKWNDIYKWQKSYNNNVMDWK